MYRCPCCQHQNKVLDNFLAHICRCQYSPCRMMDFNDDPPTKRQRCESSQSSFSSCSSCSDCSLCAEALRSIDDESQLASQVSSQQPEGDLFPQPPHQLVSNQPTVQSEPDLVFISSQSTIELSADEDEFSILPVRVSVIQYAPPRPAPTVHNVTFSQTFNDLPATPLSLHPIHDFAASSHEPQSVRVEIQPVNPIQVGGGSDLTCERCGKKYTRPKYLQNHLKVCGQTIALNNPSSAPEQVHSFKLINSAFRKYLVQYRATGTDWVDINAVINSRVPEIKSLLYALLDEFGAIKFSLGVNAEFINQVDGKTGKGGFESDLTPCLAASDKEELINDAFEILQNRIDQYTQKGSGWSMNEIKSIDLAAGKYKPHKGGCEGNEIPSFLKKKTCLISPQTRNDCFMYAILICLHRATKNPGRTSHYNHLSARYDFSRVRGIVDVESIVGFENLNNISVNVYTCYPNSRDICPLKIVDTEREKHVDLFLFNQHYYAITSFNRLISNRDKRARHFCKRCLCSFRSEKQLDSHISECKKYKAQRLVLLEPAKATLKRKDFKKETQFPVCIYADFETLNVKQEGNSNTISNLIPCSYGYIVVDWNHKIIFKDFYLGEDAGKKFLESLINSQHIIIQHIAENIKPLSLTAAEEAEFKLTKNCHICLQPLGTSIRVRDHDHLTGKFRGAAHQDCNINYKLPSQIPVVFHNLKNFDAHIIIKALDSSMIKKEIQIIPHSTEKFIGFILDDFKFLDSFAFLPASLDNLATNLTSNQKLVHLRQLFVNQNLDLLMQKGCLPYEYLDSFSKFQENLPDKAKFYSSLTESDISDEVYNHVRNVWYQFKCVKLEDLHNIYLKTDVSLLASVFENFRSMSIENFGIDPLHHFSAPGLTWAAALKTTKIELQLFSDVDMLLMIERGIRGGLTMVSKRYARANDPAFPGYNPDDPISRILYLDVNNLYGYAMSQRLPVDGYEFINTGLETILSTADDSDHGYIIDVDLEYPADLHDAQSDLPLAPEQLNIRPHMYSPYQEHLKDSLSNRGIKTFHSKKLITSFLPKTNYVVHYQTLKYYVKLGIRVIKINKVLKFNQSPWLAGYVNFCTEKRQKASSDFEKDFWKLLVNSIYGKTIEDKRKHVKVEIATQDILAERMMRKNLVKKFVILDENKVLFQMKNCKVTMDKPIAVGFSVLELAKLKMYQLHYDTFKAYFGTKIQLLYTDTDSLIYHVTTTNINNDLEKLSHLMDFSNYPLDHPLYSNENKKKIGYLKNEVAGDEIIEFIGIKPKLYAIKTLKDVKKRAKGVPRSVLKKISFEDYQICLFEEATGTGTATRIQSTEHHIGIIKQTKLTITPLEDKRYYINKIDSLPYGHYSIPNTE